MGLGQAASQGEGAWITTGRGVEEGAMCGRAPGCLAESAHGKVLGEKEVAIW